MCQGMCPLTVEEAEEVLDARRATDGRLSIVKTELNAAVAPLHGHMPPVQGPGGGDCHMALGRFASLADRSRIVLSAEPEL